MAGSAGSGRRFTVPDLDHLADERGELVVLAINPGVMTREEIALLRTVSVSQGIMLENVSERLCQKGGVHYGSPDKAPAVRLDTLRFAGELKVPFTTGILIGIGETREERLDSLLAIRELHERYGHIQEVIVQNFRAKPGTKMARTPEPALEDLMWTLAVARLTFGPEMNLQAPPNLTPSAYPPRTPMAFPTPGCIVEVRQPGGCARRSASGG